MDPAMRKRRNGPSRGGVFFAEGTVTLVVLVFAWLALDDITIDNTPFVSSRSRAEVQAELMSRSDLVRAGASEWALQRNQLPAVASSYTKEQARSEYKSARQYVNALTGEDSGSAYFAGTAARRVNASATMGGPAR